MDAILEPLVNSPQLYQHLEALQTFAQEERRRRERFYEEITPETKWEFINGEVVMHSPAKHVHTAVLFRLQRLVGTFVTAHKLGWLGGEKSLVCLTRNDYEPDLVFYPHTKAEAFTAETLHYPVPDFAVEVLSESTKRNDRGIKFTDYAAHGMPEYWIVDPRVESIEQYLLGPNGYELSTKMSEGVIHSRAIPGFTLSVRAVFDDDENMRSLWAMQPPG